MVGFDLLTVLCTAKDIGPLTDANNCVRYLQDNSLPAD